MSNQFLSNDELGNQTKECFEGIKHDAIVEAIKLERKIKPNSKFMRRLKVYNIVRFVNHIHFGAPRYGWNFGA